MPPLLLDSMPLSFKLLERSETADGRVRVRGKFQHCGVENRNKRIYPRPVWERHLKADSDFMKAIRTNKVFGHLEHPDDGRSNLNLAAIKIESLSMKEDGTITGELATLSTKAGQTAAALFNDGLQVGISSRGHGSVKKNSEGIDEVQEDFVPESFDLVAEPSTPGADLVKESLFEGYIPSTQKLTEGKIPEDVQRRVQWENGLAMLTARLEGLEKQVEEKATTSLSVHEAGDLLYELHHKLKDGMKADEFIALEERIVSVKEFSRASMPEDDFGVGSDIYRDEKDPDDDYDMPGMGEQEPADDDEEEEPGREEPGDEEGCPRRRRGEGPMQDPYWGEARKEAARKIRLGEMADDEMADELVLYIDNDGQLYRQQHEPIQKNLMTKWARGQYDSRKAVKLFMYLADDGAKKYVKEMGESRPWNIVFPKPTRLRASEMLRDAFEANARNDQYGYLLPKKYVGFVPEGVVEAMTRVGNRDLAQSIARREGKAFGMSVLDGKWYVGTPEELAKIGVTDIEEATADLYHKLEINIDFADLTPEQRQKFDLFRPGEDLSGVCSAVKTGLPADLEVVDCEGRWESGDKICLVVELKGNPKAAMRSVGGILGQKIKMEAVMGGTKKGGSALSPDVVRLVQGLRDRCRALTAENTKLDTENKRLRELTDAMAELHSREKLQRTQEDILAKHPELQAAIPELNKARTVEELKEKAGVFLGISGTRPNFGKPEEEEDDKGEKDPKQESETGRTSTKVRNGVPRPGELNEGGDTTITDGNAGTKALGEGKEDWSKRLARHYRTQ